MNRFWMDECDTCGGSGGGIDPSTKCFACHGSGAMEPREDQATSDEGVWGEQPTSTRQEVTGRG